LAALAPFLGGGRRILFAVDSDLDLLRALAIGKEFDLDLVVRGSGHEYRVLDQIRESRPEIILPLAFPDEPPVASPEEALGVSLRELQHWEAAPRNPARLVEAGIPIAFTTARLEKKKEFPERVRRAIQNGLSEEAALAALTTNPARMLGVEDRLGSIAAGKLANLVVCDGALYAKGSRILATWVDGNRHEITKRRGVEAEGIWDISCRLGEGKVKSFELELETAGKGLSGSLLQDEKRTRLQSSTLDQGRIALVVPGAALEVSGALRLSGVLSKKRIQGHGVLPGGGAFKWSATCRPVEAAARKDAAKSDSAENGKDETPALAQASAPVFPQGAFGRSRIPPQPAAVLVRGATIWTSGPAGRLENASLLIEKGKIRAVGNDVAAPPGALVIDAKGKHVTPGLIDCHSHTAIQGGVNEGTQAVTAEVRIGDVVNCNDINLYRQLAGGLTVANLLHGSANPIGGQNQVIKLRWGLDPEGLKFQGAMPGIKFALGENVKQSNWGDKFTTRYPQTRMGVEQIMRDRFESALAYERAHNDYEALADKKGVIPPRRDLELEALVEVLRGKRIVHCHSYRQDEILMLLRLAASFGFRIGTLQHILEGYKVAEAIAKHGAGASSFSDWWAYKFEVYDAIPYNGALMHDAGVVVSFNSDSSEMARRLNTEAAKAVKYGGLSEEEALRFVTLNPARQLRIDDRVGSLEAGKDADFVIWNDKPLSTHAICEETWIDGRRYFQLEEDRKLRRLARAERSRLIQKVLAASKGKKRKRQGDESQGEDEPGYSCCREELGR
ncbi:MAG: amidohydrolase family protein, partial [Planctomycetota bacterium]